MKRVSIALSTLSGGEGQLDTCGPLRPAGGPPLAVNTDCDYGPALCISCGTRAVPTAVMKCLQCSHEAVLQWREANPHRGRKK